MSQYDDIGTRYNAVKSTFFNVIERTNFKNAIQPLLVENSRVLDLACGTGFYSDLMLEWGASCVTGVDISPAMVKGAMARMRNTTCASRATFVPGDACHPQLYASEPGAFDIITGIWLLNYAKTPAELCSMFRTIFMNLKQDGAFVGVCPHPTDDVCSLLSHSLENLWARTGVWYKYCEELDGATGNRFVVTAVPPTESAKDPLTIQFSTYHLKKSIYEEAARRGGFYNKLEWRRCKFEDAWMEKLGLCGDASGWRMLREHPPLSILILRK